MRQRPKYLPIEDHGIIGNMVTAALVGLDGRVDFMCYPEYDSPSLFAGLLDVKKGGEFCLSPCHETGRTKQMYYPNTNILITRFMEEGILEVTDFMPLKNGRPVRALIRRIKSLKGPNKVSYNLAPRFDYGKRPPTAKRENDCWTLEQKHGRERKKLKVFSNVALKFIDGSAKGEFEIQEGEDLYIGLLDPDCKEEDALDEKKVEDLFAQTRKFWNEWARQCRYKGKWSQQVLRSALTLKLLLPYEHGNLVAAPTFSLPEHIGGSRNWDYRYTWIRDTTFTFYALTQLGYHEEALDYTRWVHRHCNAFAQDQRRENGPLEVLYNSKGDLKGMEEKVLPLEGHKGSGPVRIGNAAFKQKQIDIYGEFLDMLALVDAKVAPISHNMWNNTKQILEWLDSHWEDPDQSIWETRGKPRVHLFSLLMSWVAFDRGMRICDQRSLPGDIEKWRKTRDRIYRKIHEEYFNEEIQSFVQYAGTKVADASLLLMAILRFISFTDPKWISTLHYIGKTLAHDVLTKRYDLANKDMDDGIGQSEGYLVVCSFWYIENLARAGQIENARLLFERMLSHANHLGLFSEEVSVKGELLGNFPQALSHLGLINTALNLDKILEKNRRTKNPESSMENWI